MKSTAGMKFPFESVRLILNPTSGRRRAAGFGREIAAALDAAGIDVGVLETEKAGDAVRYARQSDGASFPRRLCGRAALPHAPQDEPRARPA